jgi:hypothetical protein
MTYFIPTPCKLQVEKITFCKSYFSYDPFEMMWVFEKRKKEMK